MIYTLQVTFQLPQQQPQDSTSTTTSPHHQMFEVVVPEGVRPGNPFALMANGQKVMVTCPTNVKPGQKIRFQLPIQLSNEQLSAAQVRIAVFDLYMSVSLPVLCSQMVFRCLIAHMTCDRCRSTIPLSIMTIMRNIVLTSSLTLHLLRPSAAIVRQGRLVPCAGTGFEVPLVLQQNR